MKACESGFHMRQILWQNSSWLLSNGLLSATLKTDKRQGILSKDLRGID